MKAMRLFPPIVALAIYFIFKPIYVFFFFSLVSSISLILSIAISSKFSNSAKRIEYDLEYLSSLSLMLSCFGVLVDKTFTSILYPPLGILILATIFKRHKRLTYSEDFMIILLSILGFWVIYYKLISLGYIAFLLAINTSLLIGALSYMSMEEVEADKIGERVEIKVQILQTIRGIIPTTTLYLTISYIIIWFLRDKVAFFRRINMTYFSIILLLFIFLSVLLYFIREGEK